MAKRIRTNRVLGLVVVLAIVVSVMASFWQVDNLAQDKMASVVNLTGFILIGDLVGRVEVSRIDDPFIIMAGWVMVLIGLVYARWAIAGMKSEQHAANAAACLAAGLLAMMLTYTNGTAAGIAVMILIVALTAAIHIVARVVKYSVTAIVWSGRKVIKGLTY